MIKICISVTSHALDPHPPVTNCHTSDPSPLEHGVLYGRPLWSVTPSTIDLFQLVQNLLGTSMSKRSLVTEVFCLAGHRRSRMTWHKEADQQSQDTRCL